MDLNCWRVPLRRGRCTQSKIERGRPLQPKRGREKIDWQSPIVIRRITSEPSWSNVDGERQKKTRRNPSIGPQARSPQRFASTADPMQLNRRHQNRVRLLGRASRWVMSIRLRQHAHGGRHGRERRYGRDHVNAHAVAEHDRPNQLHRYPRANEAGIAPARKRVSAIVKGICSCQYFDYQKSN